MRDKKFALTSLTLNGLYLFANFPNGFIYIVAQSSIIVNDDFMHFLDVFTSLLYYSYYALQFYVQLAFNSVVRREFVRMFSDNINGKRSMANGN
jgi:hypothetical protein